MWSLPVRVWRLPRARVEVTADIKERQLPAPSVETGFGVWPDGPRNNASLFKRVELRANI